MRWLLGSYERWKYGNENATGDQKVQSARGGTSSGLRGLKIGQKRSGTQSKEARRRKGRGEKKERNRGKETSSPKNRFRWRT